MPSIHVGVHRRERGLFTKHAQHRMAIERGRTRITRVDRPFESLERAWQLARHREHQAHLEHAFGIIERHPHASFGGR